MAIAKLKSCAIMIHLGEKLRLRVELRQQIAYARKWFCYFLSHLINSFQILLAQSSLTAMPADYTSHLTVAKSSLYFAKLSQIFQLHNTIAQLSPIIDNKRQQSAPIGTNRRLLLHSSFGYSLSLTVRCDIAALGTFLSLWKILFHALCRLFRNLYLTLRRESHRQLLILFFYYIIFSIFLNYGSKRNFGSF